MRIIVALLFILSSATASNAALNKAGWDWQRLIDLKGNSGFVQLMVTPEIFDQSQPSLNDLRVLNKDNNLVPHVIYRGQIQMIKHTEWRPARLLNATFAPKTFSKVTVDFEEKVVKNRIELQLSGENYRRRALLEGSDNNKEWEIVAENIWLFDVKLNDRHFRVNTIEFPSNDFRYLRLTVYNMVDDPRRIFIEEVKGAYSRIEDKKELVQVPVKQIKHSVDPKKKETIVEFDFGFRNLPITSVEVESAEPYFYRAFELCSRNQIKEMVPRKTETGSEMRERDVPWKVLRRGVLYRIKDQTKTTESLKIEGLDAPFRYLQLRIFNKDNPPLRIDGGTVLRREVGLIFRSEQNHYYMLIGGNPKARPADYDLSVAVKDLDSVTLPRVVAESSSEVTILHQKKRLPWSDRHNVLLWIILGIAVLITAFMIVKNLKAIDTPQKK